MLYVQFICHSCISCQGLSQADIFVKKLFRKLVLKLHVKYKSFGAELIFHKSHLLS